MLLSKPTVATRPFLLITLIVIFVVLDLSILLINYRITWQVEQDAQTINLAGRQRMLSQRISKSLLQLQVGDDRRQVINELAETSALFTQTLGAFARGGLLTNTDGRIISVDALDDPLALSFVNEAAVIFEPVHRQIERLQNNPAQQATLDKTLLNQYIQQHNLTLLELMNNLTLREETLSKQSIGRLRIYQTLAFLLAMANFVVILRLFQRRYQASQYAYENLNQLVENIGSSLLVVDNQERIVMSNRAVAELLGYEPQMLKFMPLQHVLQIEGGIFKGISREGNSFDARVHMGSFQMGNDEFTVMSLTDISGELEKQRQLERQALHDELTGLPNRRLLEDRIAQEIHRCEREGGLFAVLFIDLDGFKRINDSLGHQAGDQALKEVANRFEQHHRAIDTLSRTGGDEFVLLMVEVRSREDVGRYADALLESLKPPIALQGEQFTLSASIGISLYPEHGGSASELISRADKAMYVIKHQGKGRYGFYQSEEDEVV